MYQNCWLLSDDALQLRAAREMRGPIVARGRAGAAEAEGPASLRVDDRGTATIRVEGLLTPTPDAASEYYGEPNTTYPDLQAALRAANGDKNVREIVWSIDSPGGAVDGLFALLDDIADARASGGKPMRVEADNAHSAAYGIAAAVGDITARSRMSSFGSVGVATSSFVLGDMIGRVVHMTNTDAPEKRPEIGTPEGRQVVVRYLDQIGSEFMSAIARGRGVDAADVAASFGRGSSMLAQAALGAKMIDRIAPRGGAGGRTLTYARTAGTVRTDMDPVEATTPEAVESPAPSAPAPEAAAVPVEAIPVVLTLDDPERAELAAFRAERDARETAERRSLVTALVEVGAETPATAFANGAPVPRLAAEDLPSLRARVAALRATRPAAALPLQPPAMAELDGLAPHEAQHAEQIKDPVARERFVKVCRDMSAKAQGKI